MYKDFNDYEIIYMVSENNNDNFKILCQKYKPLIKKLVGKYYNLFKKFGYEMDDLMQLGYIALYKSSSFYNEKKTARFIIYLKKIINNMLLSEIKNNYSNKKIILNNSLSYDNLNNNISYLDFIKDDKDIFSYEEEKDYFIYFKNTLDYISAGIFEMYYNGYSLDEISKMFEEKKKTIIFKISQIKKKFHYNF